ncbi:MAG TPA: sulfotransferase domain-containing protein [Longimicrobiales bacterium]|nr:sulfotransferase domain-containing protein [Longimicrobiales bacterium]
MIGAQKCATSWLYYCLRDHPQVRLPVQKLEVEYLGGDLYEQRGADWYFGLVGPHVPGMSHGDVSVEYLYDPRAAPAVKRFLPDVRLVVVLRQPLERAISAYHWYLRKQRLPDVPLTEGLAAAARSYRHGGGLGSDLIERGLYGAQLGRWLELFRREQLLVVTYDEIASDPQAILREVFEFIGVAADFVPPSLGKRPKHNAYVAPLIRLERTFPRSRVVSKLADATSNWLYRRGVGRDRPVLSRELSAELGSLFADDLLACRNLLASAPAMAPPSRLRVLERWMEDLTA